MKYKVDIFTQAKLDLKRIVNYWENVLEVSANPLIDDYEAAVLKLSDFPFAHHQPSDSTLQSKGYRICPVRNYYIFYVVEDNIVQIHRVLYNKMDFTKLF